MSEYGFSLTCIFPYKDRILDSVKDRIIVSALIRGNIGQRKPVFWHILLSESVIKPFQTYFDVHAFFFKQHFYKQRQAEIGKTVNKC